MILRTLVVGAAAALLAAPAWAQTAPSAPPAPPAPPVASASDFDEDVDVDVEQDDQPGSSAEEAALERDGEAFGRRMQALAAEVTTIQSRTDLDAAGKQREIDAVVARARADTDAFATRVETFMRAQGGDAAEEAAAIGQTIRSVPQQVATGMRAAASAGSAAAGTPPPNASTPSAPPEASAQVPE